MIAKRTVLLSVWLAALSAWAQTNDLTHKADSPPEGLFAPTNQVDYLRRVQVAETVRTNCIQNRRIICGRIVKVLPEGLVVDSGYTSLMRHPLDRSWLIPGTVEAQREPNLIEKNEPDCVCVGLVLVTDAPKARRVKPKVFDYVVLDAFPTGRFAYNSVGTVQRTVRRFSASLPIAVRLNLDAGNK